jgi:phosphatidylserine decarboxylase precursor
MSESSLNFHLLVGYSPNDILNNDKEFREWLGEFAKEHGKFLNTNLSAGDLHTFIENPEYRIQDYDPGPGGWMSFNQFFTRRFKPGMRPIDEPCNNKVIVSPTDSVYLGNWPIDSELQLNVKGTNWSISELIDGSEYAERFAGGVFTHSYLEITDYHRYHVPVGGEVLEARILPGDVITEIGTDLKGDPTVKDEIGFQFKQARGILILETIIGLVAVIPVGMGHTSSINFTAEQGVRLVKGEECGYFAQGGSDMILLFENNVRFTAEPGRKYQVGRQIALAT